MKFDYLELLTIKKALEFTQSKSDVLNFDCLIKKITQEINKNGNKTNIDW